MGEDETAVTLSPARLEAKGFLKQPSIPRIDQVSPRLFRLAANFDTRFFRNQKIEPRSNLS